MSSPRPVLLFSTSPRGVVGGMERVASSVAEGLRAQGHPVIETFAEPVPDRGSASRWGVRLRTVRTKRRVPTAQSVVHALTDTARLARWLDDVRPSVVNVHFATDQALPFLALRLRFGYRLVLTCHGSDVLRTASPIARRVLPTLLRRADAVIAVSDAVADRIRQLAPRSPVTVIPNGVDLDFWTPAPTTASGSATTVVQVGRLHEVKGQDVLLRALPLVQERVPGVGITFVGDGPERDGLGALADDLGVASAVTFAGPLPPEAVREHVRRAAACVLPSRSEGLPLTMLEAMACGAPVVASAVGGVPGAAGEPPAALLVPPDAPDALATALADVLTRPSLAAELRARARDRATEYSWDRAFAAHARVLLGD